MWPVLLSKTQITGDFSCAAGCLVPVQVELEADAVATLLVWTRSPALTSANNRWEEGKREEQPVLPPKYRHIGNNSYDILDAGKPATPAEARVGRSPDFSGCRERFVPGRGWEAGLSAGHRQPHGWGLEACTPTPSWAPADFAGRNPARAAVSLPPTLRPSNSHGKARLAGTAKAKAPSVCGHQKVPRWCCSFTLPGPLVRAGHGAKERRQWTGGARLPGRHSSGVAVSPRRWLPQKTSSKPSALLPDAQPKLDLPPPGLLKQMNSKAWSQ